MCFYYKKEKKVEKSSRQQAARVVFILLFRKQSTYMLLVNPYRYFCGRFVHRRIVNLPSSGKACIPGLSSNYDERIYVIIIQANGDQIFLFTFYFNQKSCVVLFLWTNCPQPYFFMSSGSIDMLQRRRGVPIGVEPRAWLLQSRFFVHTWYNVNGSFLNVFVAFICSCRQNRKIFFI